jgi:hypothetical protein
MSVLTNIMGRHVLRLVGIGVVAIAIPQCASAFDSASGAAFKLAMGPTSAAQKRGGPPAAADTTGTIARASPPRNRARSRAII